MASSTGSSRLSRRPSQDSLPISSSASSTNDSKSIGNKITPRHRLSAELAGLYSGAICAKLWKVAVQRLEDGKEPAEYPEWAPEDGETPGQYNTKEVNFWTCGFFPGNLYCILERCVKYPLHLPLPGLNRSMFHTEFLRLCRAWAAPLHQMAKRSDTHDLGFITQPALRQDWELTGNYESLASIITAANNLASRYDETMKAVRSWDKSVSTRYNIMNKETNFLVIVDSMCNMDLLFYAGHQTSDQRLVDIATNHAHFVRRNLIRNNNSTWHVVNFDPRDASLKTKHTHQGCSDDSTWSRGQAWTILGFAQTYIWTKEQAFLDAAISLTEYFLERLRSATHAYPYVPLWDFDAPIGDKILRDSSAGMIAANGLLLLHQILGNDSKYLDDALRIAGEIIDMCQTTDSARLVTDAASKIKAQGVTFDCILKHATANNNEYALMRYSDHGLVYADYYFLEFGNKLLRMGMV
ncbi:unsaturated glucuronyl hydrolase [Trichoderma arundinaceum]|uniref:Unsaturated glucuronyl hydrolase n=1 Tax=Trichoderma arundinaceum TaxID=490622 RepID=A0A395NYX2_TRIAR|nr:unsaturated glucuronyl hydrolase [Trichoderma arundinaceum]